MFTSLFLSLQLTSLVLLFVGVIVVSYRVSPFHPLHPFPGPILYRCTDLTIMFTVATGKRHLVIADLHEKYGKFVRIGMSSDFFEAL